MALGSVMLTGIFAGEDGLSGSKNSVLQEEVDGRHRIPLPPFSGLCVPGAEGHQARGLDRRTPDAFPRTDGPRQSRDGRR